MQLDAQARFELLSAGMNGAFCWAAAWCASDLLLLDEPTNHLALMPSAGWRISWRAGVERSSCYHDRVFLQKLASRIVELDRGRLFRLELQLRCLSAAQRRHAECRAWTERFIR